MGSDQVSLMPRIPLTSGAYSAQSLIANAQRCLNLFTESNPQDTNPPVPVTHYPRPGLTPLSSPPVPGTGRCLYASTHDQLFAVIDQSAYYIDPDFQYNLIGQVVSSSRNPVIISDNGTNAMLVDGDSSGNIISLTAPYIMTTIGDPNFLGADRVDFLDTFLVLNQPNTRNFYCTLANQVSFNGLYIGTKTAWPDNVVGVCCVERAAWVFGPRKSEIWFNAGSVPFPFQIQPGLIIEHGCVAKYSIAKQDVNVYWLSQSPEGARMAMKGAQNIAQRISTHAIENEWKNYNRVDDCIGSTYQINGHAFYCLDFPTADKTWVYDEATKQWHEETHIDINGVRHRSLVPYKAYCYGRNLGLDWQTGNLYQLDTTNYTDNGRPIEFLRSFPHTIANESERITVWRFVADVEVGTTEHMIAVPYQDNSPWSGGFSPGFGPLSVISPPLISLRTSRTRGASWGNAVMQPMGATGLYYTRPTWNRLGFFVDGVFELSWSSPMKTALNGAFITTEPHEADV